MDLREVMRRWVTGVTIVTVEQDGQLHGATVSSFTSISVDPPIITITLARNSRTHQMLRGTREFGITVLGLDQQELSERFSGQVPDGLDRFEGIGFHYFYPHVPILNGGLAGLACKVIHQYEMANSTLFAAEVLAAELGEEQSPLVYVNRSYRRLEE